MTDDPRAKLRAEFFQRDLADAAIGLGKWAQEYFGADAIIGPVTATGGLSTELLLFDLTWSENGVRRTQRLVARIDPAGYRKRPVSSLAKEYGILKLLRKYPDVPAPAVYAFEEDGTYLGQPFFVMAWVEGEVPQDHPPYGSAGWLADLPPERQHKIWQSGIASLAAIHRVDQQEAAAAIGFTSPEDPLRVHFQRWRDIYDWSLEDAHNPVGDQAWRWLEENFPDDAPRGLSWGDARWGNMMFRDDRCVAILDWEDVAISSPLLDLGRWRLAEIFHEEGGSPRPRGFGSHAEMLQRWEKLTGMSTRHVRWAEIFNGCCSIALLARTATLQRGRMDKSDGPPIFRAQIVENFIKDRMGSSQDH